MGNERSKELKKKAKADKAKENADAAATGKS